MDLCQLTGFWNIYSKFHMLAFIENIASFALWPTKDSYVTQEPFKGTMIKVSKSWYLQLSLFHGSWRHQNDWVTAP